MFVFCCDVGFEDSVFQRIEDTGLVDQLVPVAGYDDLRRVIDMSRDIQRPLYYAFLRSDGVVEDLPRLDGVEIVWLDDPADVEGKIIKSLIRIFFDVEADTAPDDDSELLGIREELSESQAEVARLTARCGLLEDQVNNLNADLDSANSTLQTQRTSLGNASAVERERDSLAEQLSTALSQLRDVETSYGELQTQFADVRAELQEAREAANSESAGDGVDEAELQSLKDELSRVSEEREAGDQEIGRLRGKVSELESSAQTLENRCVQAEADLKHQLDVVADLRRELAESKFNDELGAVSDDGATVKEFDGLHLDPIGYGGMRIICVLGYGYDYGAALAAVGLSDVGGVLGTVAVMDFAPFVGINLLFNHSRRTGVVNGGQACYTECIMQSSVGVGLSGMAKVRGTKSGAVYYGGGSGISLADLPDGVLDRELKALKAAGIDYVIIHLGEFESSLKYLPDFIAVGAKIVTSVFGDARGMYYNYVSSVLTQNGVGEEKRAYVMFGELGRNVTPSTVVQLPWGVGVGEQSPAVNGLCAQAFRKFGSQVLV